jgi:hypothetical protein
MINNNLFIFIIIVPPGTVYHNLILNKYFF